MAKAMTASKKLSLALSTSSTDTQKKKDAILALLFENHMITEIVRTIGIDRKTYYNWLDNDPEFAQSVEAVKESRLQFVENAAFKLVREGDTAMTIFLLKTLGREKYQEIQQIDLTQRNINITYVNDWRTR